LEIKQFSHETISAYIGRLEARQIQAQDIGFLKLILSLKRHLLMVFLSQFKTKLRMGQNQELIFGPKEEFKLSLKKMVLQLKDKQILWLDLKPMLKSSSLRLLR